MLSQLRSASPKIVNTPDLKHGHVVPVKHNSTSLFDCIPPVQTDSEPSSNIAEGSCAVGQVDVVAYNSLTVSWHGECAYLYIVV